MLVGQGVDVHRVHKIIGFGLDVPNTTTHRMTRFTTEDKRKKVNVRIDEDRCFGNLFTLVIYNRAETTANSINISF